MQQKVEDFLSKMQQKVEDFFFWTQILHKIDPQKRKTSRAQFRFNAFMYYKIVYAVKKYYNINTYAVHISCSEMWTGLEQDYVTT